MDLDMRRRIEALPPERRALFERLYAQRREPVTQELSVTQRGLWFIERLLPYSALYTIAWRCTLAGPVDTAAFERAVRAVSARHEALRTRFGTVDGRAVQIVEPEPQVSLLHDDLTGRPDRDAAVDRLIGQDLRAGFDLERGPLFKVRLVRTGDEAWTALLYLHHIVFDAGSTGILLTELCALYREELTGEPAGLAPPTRQYGDYVSWQLDRLRGDRLASLVDFWRRTLDGAPPLLEVPPDRPRPAVQSFAGAAHRLVVPAPQVAAMSRLAAAERCSLYMAYLAVFQAVLARWTGRTDICVGTPAANRGRPEFASLVGFCVNMIVMRTELSGATFRELLGRVRRVCLDAYEHQELPFDLLVEELAPSRGLSHNPLFQVACVLDPEPGTRLSLGPAVVESVAGLHPGMAKFDISFAGVMHGEEIVVTVDYSTDLYDAATVERLAGHFRRLWEQAVAAPDKPVGELPMLGDDEPVAVSTPPAAGPGAAEGVAARAAAEPGAVAVTGPSGTLTYGALDEAARVAPGDVDLDLRDGVRAEHLATLLAAERAGTRVRLRGGTAEVRHTPASLAAVGRAVAAALGLTERDRVAAGGTEPLHVLAQALGALAAGATVTLPGDLEAGAEARRPTVRWLSARRVAGLTPDDALRLVVTDAPPIARSPVPVVAAALTARGLLAAAGGDERVGPPPGSAVRVLDDEGRPVPAGVPGRGHLAGDQVTGEPEPTDLVLRLHADGRLEWLGRRTDPIAGSPGAAWQVERLVATHPGVADAALLRAAGEPGTLLAVAAAADDRPRPREIEAFLADRMPAGRLPGAVVVVDALPVGPDGAVDLAGVWHGAEPERQHVEPRTALERVLVSVWTDLLPAERVGVDDNFFDLGGHSLLAVELLGTLNELFGAELPISVLFGASTPATLAVQLGRALGGPETAERLAASVEEILSLSEDEVQRRLAELPDGPGDPA